MKKGFTLIELLVVIAILAVLATAVVLVLNPAELLRQGRDSTRLSDLAALHNSLVIWTADVFATALNWTAANRCTSTSTSPGGVVGGCVPFSTSTAVDGTAWVPINLKLIAVGSPLSRLPFDPNNGGVCSKANPAICQYAISVSSTIGIYEIDAAMESAKFNANGSSRVTDNDGGSDPNFYETGTKLTLF